MLDVTGTYWFPGASRADMLSNRFMEWVNDKVLNFVMSMLMGGVIPLFIFILLAFASGNKLAMVGSCSAMALAITISTTIIFFDVRCTRFREKEWTQQTRLAMWVLFSPVRTHDRKIVWLHRKEIEIFLASYPFNSIEWGLSGDRSREEELRLREEIYAEGRRIAVDVLGYDADAFDARLREIKMDLPVQEHTRITSELAAQRTLFLTHEIEMATADERLKHLEMASAQIAR